jgi:hypothetical protein
MIDDEFPPHGAHLTVVVVAQHTETSKVPHAPKIAEENKLSPQSLLLCLSRIAISLPNQEGTSIAYWIGAFFD